MGRALGNSTLCVPVQVRQFREESTARQTRLVHVANNPPPRGPRQITGELSSGAAVQAFQGTWES